MGEETRAVSLREQALEAIKAWEGLYEREKQRAEQLQQQAETHAQEARTANATIHEIYQLCTGATGEPGNWHGAEPVRRIVTELREAKQALAEVRPEINSLIKGLHRSHVNPSDGTVHDEDVAHEISQLTELHERIVRLIGDHRPETENTEPPPVEIRGYVNMPSYEPGETTPTPGERIIGIRIKQPEWPNVSGLPAPMHWLKSLVERSLAAPPPESEPTTAQIVEAQQWPIGDAPHTPEQTGDALAALKRVRSMIEECEVGDTEFGDNEENREVMGRLNDIDYAIEPIVRRHLTAGGVSSVPEEVRRLVDYFNGMSEQLPQSPDSAQAWAQASHMLQKALASAPADGYRLVPVEPTHEQSVRGNAVLSGGNPYGIDSSKVYRAMIAAAPTDGRE